MKNCLRFLLFLAYVGAYPALAQTNHSPCGTQSPGDDWEKQLAVLIQQLNQNAQSASAQAPVYTIPVIMHVVHNGESIGTYPNLANGQLVSQIRVLNQDFGGIGYNYWNYPASAYATWAVNQSLPQANLDALGRVKIANCNVQFCLATKDTLGNTLAEPGIDRINRITKGWQNPAGFTSLNSFRSYMDNTIKPGSVWNVTRYLNIWVTDININATGLLGYATFPPLTTLLGLNSSNGTATTDGCWCYARAYGSDIDFPGGYYYNSNTKGRTASHEVGHWLGLRHVWGDSFCANDFCNDTPPATAANSGLPSYPHKSGQCALNAPNGEMYMNIMDYSDDAGKYMFSTDQATRVQTTMANSPYRKFLGTHNLCSVAPVAATASFAMVVNSCVGSTVVLGNSSWGTPLPNYTWSANGPGTPSFFPDANTAQMAIFPSPGTYTVTLNASNNTTSTFSKVINIGAIPGLSVTAPPFACVNDDIQLSATGGNTYVWQPGGLGGPSVVYPAQTVVGSTNFTCIAIGAFNCRATYTFELNVADCTGIDEQSGGNSFFKFFPNPASTEIHLKLTGEPQKQLKLEIFDIAGRLVMQLPLNETQSGEIVVSTASLNPGAYSLCVTNEQGRRQSLMLYKH